MKNDEGRPGKAAHANNYTSCDGSARFIVRRRRGEPLRALSVEHLPDGWLRVVTKQTRIEIDEEQRVGRLVVVGTRERRLPAWQVLEIVELSTSSTRVSKAAA